MLKRREIQLAQRPLIDYGVGHHTCMLLAVGGKVFEACANAATLDTSHHCRAELTRNNRVLAEILEVATAQRVALNVHTRTENHVNALPTRLLANRGANTLDQLWIERTGKRRSRGKTRRRAAFRNAHAILGALLLAQSVRSVGEK